MSSIFSPKIPTPPPMIMPEIKDVPSFADEERDRIEKQKLTDAELKRKGRRSTILTGSGLNEIDPQELNKKTLLGA